MKKKRAQLHAFSHASREPHVFSASFDWLFNGSSVCVVIGQSNYYGFYP